MFKNQVKDETGHLPSTICLEIGGEAKVALNTVGPHRLQRWWANCIRIDPVSLPAAMPSRSISNDDSNSFVGRLNLEIVKAHGAIDLRLL